MSTSPPPGLVVDRQELLSMLRRFKKVFVVKRDMTYRVKSVEELDPAEDIGLIGFAIANGRGIAWLESDKGFHVIDIDLRRYYAHPSLAPGKIKLSEVF